jgi:hypothetical protein
MERALSRNTLATKATIRTHLIHLPEMLAKSNEGITKGFTMLLITVVIGLPLFLGLAAAGALVESINPMS